MYRVSVYWSNGISAWQGKLDERDVVHTVEARWLWLARWFARTHLGNEGRLAYVIHGPDGIVEES